MLPNDVESIFIHCPNENVNLEILFDIAIYWGTRRESVWIVTSKQIDRIPPKWVQSVPNREILELLTFLCIPNKIDLLDRLNKIQIWPQTPRIIIISHLDKYFEYNKNNLDINAGALCCFSSIEAAHVCKKKLEKSTILIGTFSTEHNTKILQSLINLYFYENIFELNESNYNEIFINLEAIFSKMT